VVIDESQKVVDWDAYFEKSGDRRIFAKSFDKFPESTINVEELLVSFTYLTASTLRKRDFLTAPVQPGERKKWLKRLTDVQNDGRLVSMKVLSNERDYSRLSRDPMTSYTAILVPRSNPHYKPAGITVNVYCHGTTCYFVMNKKLNEPLFQRKDNRVLLNPAGCELVSPPKQSIRSKYLCAKEKWLTECDLSEVLSKNLWVTGFDYQTEDDLWESAHLPEKLSIKEDWRLRYIACRVDPSEIQRDNGDSRPCSTHCVPPSTDSPPVAFGQSLDPERAGAGLASSSEEEIRRRRRLNALCERFQRVRDFQAQTQM